MPIAINSPARNLFLLGSSGAQLVTNFFKSIDQSASTDSNYLPEEIRYYETLSEEDRFVLSGSANDNNLIRYGWFEDRSTSGVASYSNKIQSTQSEDTYLRALELDSNNNLIAVGKTGTIPWISKYTIDGVIEWQSTTNSADVEYTGIASDSNGQYYACGTSTSGQAFVEKFDANGNPGWGKSALMLGRNVVLGKIDTNSRGHVVAVGYLEDDTNDKGYIIKIDTNTGEVLWDRTIETDRNVRCSDIFIDDNDIIYITANLTYDVGGTPSGCLLKYTAEGNLLWQTESDCPDNDQIEFSRVQVDGETQSVVVFGFYRNNTTSKDFGLLSKYAKDGSLVWRRTIESSESSGAFFETPALDSTATYYYILFTDQSNSPGGGLPDRYTFAKLSSSGNGLGAFQYNDGTGETMDYVYSNLTDKLAKLADGSVRNDTSDFVTYPFSANKILFDDLATQVTNKRRQMDGPDSFEYSGSPAIRPADFQELFYTTNTTQVKTTGQERLYTTVGTFSFVVPNGVTEVSAVCVGGGGGAGNSTGPSTQFAGGGGGGGGLAYGTFAVTPGESLTVVVGAGGAGGAQSSNGTAIAGSSGGDTTISRGATVLLNGGGGGGGLAPSGNTQLQTGTEGVGGTSTGTERDGGGTGGKGGRGSQNLAGGAGGGAAGYSGDGGNGSEGNSNSNGTAGSGGGGSGGTSNTSNCGGGGGVGVINGEGQSGGLPPVTGAGGNGGSFGAQGTVGNGVSNGGLYGGGGGSDDDDVSFKGGDGAQGAARIIWGSTRSFPSTLTLPDAGFTFIDAVKDNSNKGRTGEIEGISANASGYWEFTGTDNTYIATQKCNEIFEDGGSGTIEMWVRLNDVTTRQTLCSGYLSSGSTQPDRWDFEVQTSLLRGGSHDNSFFAGTTTLSTATWYHFVFTLDKSSGNGTLKAYINAAEEVTQNFTSDRDWATDVQFCIGNRYLQSSDFPLNADVGEVRCYRRALEETQILQNYNATKSKYINEAPDTAPKIGSGIVYDSNLLLNYDFGNRATYDRAENLLESSEEFDSNYWVIQNCIVEDVPDELSPVGSKGVKKVSVNAVGPTSVRLKNFTIVEGGFTYTASVYVKDAGAPAVTLFNDGTNSDPNYAGAGSYYNLSGPDAGQVFGSNSDSAGMEYVGNGWWRCWFTDQYDSGGNWHPLTIVPQHTGAFVDVNSQTNANGKGCYIWGAQVEKSATLGRYIKTYGSAITAPTKVKNLSSTNFPGTITSATFNNAGYFEFDGTDDEIITDDNINQANLPLTYECWVRTANGYSPSDYVSLMSTYDPNPEGFWILLNPTNAYVTAGNDGSTFHISSTAVNDGDWHHVVATLDIPNVRIYVDGVDVGGLNNAPNNTIPSTRFVRIGSMSLSGSSDRFLDGDIGEARIYNRALSATEVSQNFNATRSKYGV